MTQITQETIIKTRQWFADNRDACIAEVQDGRVSVNNPEKYFAQCNEAKIDFLAGKYDHSFSFVQRAQFIQTGKFVALLP